MASYNEISYMIYDELKLGSDDERFTIEHILFLMGIWRSYILKQKYTDVKKDIPLSNYQTICVDLEYNNDCMKGEEVKSTKPVPEFVNLNGNESITINPVGDLFKNIEFTLVSDSRFSYAGNNKYLKNIIYFTKGSDYYLYLKSINPNFQYLKSIQMSALFDNPVEASKMSCDSQDTCNYLDKQYPLEESLVPVLIDLVVKELTNPIYKPEDEINNASDDLSGLGTTKR